MANISKAFPGLFSYNDLLNMDRTDFQLWSMLSVVSLFRDTQKNSLSNNLSMADSKAWDECLKQSMELSIIDEKVIDQILESSEEKIVDNKPKEEEYWDINEYKNMMKVAKYQLTAKK